LIRPIAVILVALALGCAAPRYMLNQAERPATIAPKPGLARLVVIRSGSLCFFITVDEFLDARMIGQTRGKSFFVADVEPGVRYVTARGTDTDTVGLNFEAGRVYFLELHMYPGGFVRLAPMEAEKALAATGRITYRTYKGEGPDMTAEAFRKTVGKFERKIHARPDKYKDITEYNGWVPTAPAK
jgi:hypothetical protein